MKLSPPVISSDLEVARAIAQRLHQRRRGSDVAPLSSFEPVRPAPALAERPAVEVPPPVWSVEPAPGPSPEPVDDFSTLGESALDGPAFSSGPEQAERPAPPPEAPATGVSAEDLLVGEDEPPNDATDPGEPDAPEAPGPLAFDEPEPADEDLFAPPPPSWDEIAETCLSLASARGAMLVDPVGQVVSARGEWPEPGPELIAGKLVAMMGRTLRDAPTRSVSAPLAGLHLTAWRVPLAEGLVTAAFIAQSPVRADARPAIDAEIRRGAGA